MPHSSGDLAHARMRSSVVNQTRGQLAFHGLALGFAWGMACADDKRNRKWRRSVPRVESRALQKDSNPKPVATHSNSSGAGAGMASHEETHSSGRATSHPRISRPLAIVPKQCCRAKADGESRPARWPSGRATRSAASPTAADSRRAPPSPSSGSPSVSHLKPSDL